MARPKKYTHPVEITFLTELQMRDELIIELEGKSIADFLNKSIRDFLDGPESSLPKLISGEEADKLFDAKAADEAETRAAYAAKEETRVKLDETISRVHAAQVTAGEIESKHSLLKPSSEVDAARAAHSLTVKRFNKARNETPWMVRFTGPV